MTPGQVPQISIYGRSYFRAPTRHFHLQRQTPKAYIWYPREVEPATRKLLTVGVYCCHGDVLHYHIGSSRCSKQIILNYRGGVAPATGRYTDVQRCLGLPYQAYKNNILISREVAPATGRCPEVRCISGCYIRLPSVQEILFKFRLVGAQRLSDCYIRPSRCRQEITF
jgi:hypothetical protein